MINLTKRLDRLPTLEELFEESITVEPSVNTGELLELAIKALEEIAKYKKGEALVYVQDIKSIAKTTLEEIRRNPNA